jgi:hypothetical protein
LLIGEAHDGCAILTLVELRYSEGPMAAPDPQPGEPIAYMRRVVRSHRRMAVIRAGASLAMWLFAVGAFLTGLAKAEHFVGVTAAVAFLVLMNPPNLWILKRFTRLGPFHAFCVAIHAQEILGYTAIIHSLGGIEAGYLAPLYGALIASVGLISTPRLPYVLAAISSAAFALMATMEHTGILSHHLVVARADRPWNAQSL